MPDADGVKVALVAMPAEFPGLEVGPLDDLCSDLFLSRAHSVDIAGRTLDSTGHEANFDG